MATTGAPKAPPAGPSPPRPQAAPHPRSKTAATSCKCPKVAAKLPGRIPQQQRNQRARSPIQSTGCRGTQVHHLEAWPARCCARSRLSTGRPSAPVSKKHAKKHQRQQRGETVAECHLHRCRRFRTPVSRREAEPGPRGTPGRRAARAPSRAIARMSAATCNPEGQLGRAHSAGKRAQSGSRMLDRKAWTITCTKPQQAAPLRPPSNDGSPQVSTRRPAKPRPHLSIGGGPPGSYTHRKHRKHAQPPTCKHERTA